MNIPLQYPHALFTQLSLVQHCETSGLCVCVKVAKKVIIL